MKAMFSVSSVCDSACLGRGLQVTIAHDALGLTLQSPGPGSDTWWWLLKHARTVCKRVVRILLECILVWLGEYFRKKLTSVLLINITKEGLMECIANLSKLERNGVTASWDGHSTEVTLCFQIVTGTRTWIHRFIDIDVEWDVLWFTSNGTRYNEQF